MSTGGAAGPIFGSLFSGGATALTSAEQFDAAALADFLTSGMLAVQQRGSAQVGDKTLIDALQPAAQRADELRGQPLGEALSAVAQAAATGMESTRGLQARFGKAKSLGERAIGHVDPGALSFTRMLESMAAWPQP
jgi:dihydroxyacetone kinase-like protein